MSAAVLGCAGGWLLPAGGAGGAGAGGGGGGCFCWCCLGESGCAGGSGSAAFPRVDLRCFFAGGCGLGSCWPCLEPAGGLLLLACRVERAGAALCLCSCFSFSCFPRCFSCCCCCLEEGGAAAVLRCLPLLGCLLGGGGAWACVALPGCASASASSLLRLVERVFITAH